MLALVPLYCVPVHDHHALTVRLPRGGPAELVLYDGGGVTRSVAVWRLSGCVLLLVPAADA